jgi:uncharacterized membrane protein
MGRYLYISPAIVAIIIFIYMRNVQAKRTDKLRRRLGKRENELNKMLLAQKDITENKNAKKNEQ